MTQEGHNTLKDHVHSWVDAESHTRQGTTSDSSEALAVWLSLSNPAGPSWQFINKILCLPEQGASRGGDDQTGEGQRVDLKATAVSTAQLQKACKVFHSCSSRARHCCASSCLPCCCACAALLPSRRAKGSSCSAQKLKWAALTYWRSRGMSQVRASPLPSNACSPHPC